MVNWKYTYHGSMVKTQSALQDRTLRAKKVETVMLT